MPFMPVACLFRAQQHSGFAGRRTAELGVDANILVGVVKHQPTAAPLGLATISPLSARHSAWPKVCQPVRLEPAKVASG